MWKKRNIANNLVRKFLYLYLNPRANTKLFLDEPGISDWFLDKAISEFDDEKIEISYNLFFRLEKQEVCIGDVKRIFFDELNFPT